MGVIYHQGVRDKLSLRELLPYRWTYTNAAARNAATGFTSDDLGHLARQLDDNSLWMLTATTPTWVGEGSGGGSGGSVSASGTLAANAILTGAGGSTVQAPSPLST